MKTMKAAQRVLSFVGGLGILLTAGSLCAETLYGPGVISVGTNETILLTTVNADGVGDIELEIPDLIVSIDLLLWGSASSPVFALTGPHNLYVSARFGNSNFFLTFQRITNSPIKTVLTYANTTNYINVEAGRTIQLFPPLGISDTVWLQPAGSTNWMQCHFATGCPSPSLTGPVTIKVGWSLAEGNFRNATVLSYYFTDEVVQFPPSGILKVPAPQLQVNVEKSYDLKKWMPAAVFHTEAETGAFYRLRMLK
jgi:hypothetical protein